MAERNALDARQRQAAQLLESYGRAGLAACRRAPPGAKAATIVSASAALPDAPAAGPVASASGEVGEAGASAERQFDTPPRLKVPVEEAAAALSVIAAEVARCTKCDELARTRTQTVFGVGNPRARLCFLGEAPGADEDRQGEPFVGRAGQLLTRIIEACTLKRSDVYILNVLKCRPPGNRNPLPHEVHNCRGFLDRQLDIIQPEFICCLGAVAAHTLLETDTPIGRMRGRFLDYRGIPVMCTYHPAYVLRNPDAKRPVWEDMKLLMARMGIQLQ